MTWVLLNPSTADGSKDDPTVRRCVGFAERWGYGGMVVVNLFALRSTDPKALKTHASPDGLDNDAAVWVAVRQAELVVVAWGAHGGEAGRRMATRVRDALGKAPMCFGVNKGGDPKHPLYQANDARLVPYMGGAPDGGEATSGEPRGPRGLLARAIEFVTS